MLTYLFTFILINNLLGIIPYSFAFTSHFILTFSLSFTIVLGATILGFEKYGLKFFSLFVPAGCLLVLLPLLVAIEFISYLARAVSLGLRLAANVLSGHMLLLNKVLTNNKKVYLDSSNRIFSRQDRINLINQNKILINLGKRHFSSSPQLRYPDGGDDFSSLPNFADGYDDNGPLDNEGNPMTPFRAELENLNPNFNSTWFDPIPDTNCSTRAHLIFNSALNQTVQSVHQEYTTACTEYMQAKQAYDNNQRYSTSYFSWLRENPDPSLLLKYNTSQQHLKYTLETLEYLNVVRTNNLVPDNFNVNDDGNQQSLNIFWHYIRGIMHRHGNFVFRYGDSNIVECDLAHRYNATTIHDKVYGIDRHNYTNTTMSPELRLAYDRAQVQTYQYRVESNEEILDLIHKSPKKEAQFFVSTPGSSVDSPYLTQLPPARVPFVPDPDSAELSTPSGSTQQTTIQPHNPTPFPRPPVFSRSQPRPIAPRPQESSQVTKPSGLSIEWRPENN